MECVDLNFMHCLPSYVKIPYAIIKLAEAFKDDPAMYQWASTLIGDVVSEIVSVNVQAGASTAASRTKNNILSHEQEKEKMRI